MKIPEILQVETSQTAASLASVLKVIADAGLLLEHVTMVHRERNGCEHAHRVVGGQQTDQNGGEAHRGERGDQCRLAADAIAEMTEQGRPHRPRQECERESREGLQFRGRGISGREEQAREDEHGGRRVDIEVEELDGCADQAGDKHLAG